jgi:hypothetical protein
MKKISKLFALILGTGMVFQAAGQSAEDVMRFSQVNRGFGTARSAAMGGAFSSLGADLSVMSMNPAGLGMYRRSEFGVSPSFTAAQVETSPGGLKMNRNGLKINNMGIAFNVYSGSDALTSATFGFTYNRMNDLNFRSNLSVDAGNASRLDAWGTQLQDIANIDGIVPPEDPSKLLDAGPFNPDEWGAVNAYNAYLLDYWASPDANGNHSYNTQGIIDEHTRFRYDYLRKNRGYVGQYDIAGGFNMRNKFYFGFSLGLQELRYVQDYTYSEFASNNGANSLDSYDYNTNMDMTGSAWNLKLGAIYRPIEDLRLAVAFHTPTYIDIDEMYAVRTDARFNGFEDGFGEVRYPESTRYNMRTPPRVILGASYTIFGQAILSLDYERVWYNNMKVFRNSWEDEDTYVATDAKAWYRPTNNIRVGLETMLADNIFGRVGYAFYDSFYKDSALSKYAKVSNYSAGIGYRTDEWGIDLAYIHMDSQDAPDRAYVYGNYYSDEFTAKNRRHNVTATLSFRF